MASGKNMNQKKEILYLKIEQNTVVNKADVTIKDVGKIQCEDARIKARIHQMRIYHFGPPPKHKKHMAQTFSVLKVIELIQAEYPNLTILNLGESDFVVHYVWKKNNGILQGLKVALICVALFVGGALTILTFNKDASVMRVFDIFYQQVTGRQANGVTILDIGYCIGLPLGILLFYNHFGKKKLTDDPTPIQVSMRKYEQDVDTTYIENSSREGKSVDVD